MMAYPRSFRVASVIINFQILGNYGLYKDVFTRKKIAEMNYSRSGCSGFVSNKKIYVFGGLSFDEKTQTTVIIDLFM